MVVPHTYDIGFAVDEVILLSKIRMFLLNPVFSVQNPEFWQSFRGGYG